MSKIVAVLLVGIMLLSFASAAYAKGPGDKLVRGIANILSGWVEIPQTIDEEWKVSKNMGVGIFAGFFKGLAFAMGRMMSGTWDVITFPAAAPRYYEPLFKPDYVFDRYGPEGTVGTPRGDVPEYPQSTPNPRRIK
ncbi:exosortase system-associated protein, TIGR04073 family [bacterium]|nr:MAG: exosortase system-associated protein, TIGR04073 family [bacterium]